MIFMECMSAVVVNIIDVKIFSGESQILQQDDFHIYLFLRFGTDPLFRRSKPILMWRWCLWIMEILKSFPHLK